MKLLVREIAGEDAITVDDGQVVYDRIRPELLAGHGVELDFENVGVFASPFFNAAIGQLLRDLKPEELNRLLQLAHLSPSGYDVLRRVIENAKKYYASPEYREAQSRVLRQMGEAD